MSFNPYRVLKQALKSSGSNCTHKHMEELSLCLLFLLDVAKKVDLQTGTPYRSGHHAVKDENKDITTMAIYILETMNDIPFDDPVSTGMKIQGGWIKDFVKNISTCSDTDEASEDNASEQGVENNLDYELHLFNCNILCI